MSCSDKDSVVLGILLGVLLSIFVILLGASAQTISYGGKCLLVGFISGMGVMLCITIIRLV